MIDLQPISERACFKYFSCRYAFYCLDYLAAIFTWAYYMVHQNTYIVPLSDDLAHPYSMHEVSAAASCGVLNHIGFA